MADDAGGLLHVLQGPHLRHRGLAANLDGTEVLHRVVIGVVAAVAAGETVGRIVPKGGPPRGELPAKEVSLPPGLQGKDEILHLLLLHRLGQLLGQYFPLLRGEIFPVVLLVLLVGKIPPVGRLLAVEGGRNAPHLMAALVVRVDVLPLYHRHVLVVLVPVKGLLLLHSGGTAFGLQGIQDFPVLELSFGGKGDLLQQGQLQQQAAVGKIGVREDKAPELFALGQKGPVPQLHPGDAQILQVGQLPQEGEIPPLLYKPPGGAVPFGALGAVYLVAVQLFDFHEVTGDLGAPLHILFNPA